MLFGALHLLFDPIFILYHCVLISCKHLAFSENPLSGITSFVRYFTSSCRHYGRIRVISFPKTDRHAIEKNYVFTGSCRYHFRQFILGGETACQKKVQNSILRNP